MYFSLKLIVEWNKENLNGIYAKVWVNEVDKHWYGDESDMYEHLVSVIEQWRKWKEMDKSAYSQN